MNEIKYPALWYAKELANVPIEEVAKIAAVILSDKKTYRATRQRVELMT